MQNFSLCLDKNPTLPGLRNLQVYYLPPNAPLGSLQDLAHCFCHRKASSLAVGPIKIVLFGLSAANRCGIVVVIVAIPRFSWVNSVKVVSVSLRIEAIMCKAGSKINRDFATSLE